MDIDVMNNVITKTTLSSNTYGSFAVGNSVTTSVAQSIPRQQPLNTVVEPKKTENKKISSGAIKALATIGGTIIGGIGSIHSFMHLAYKKCIVEGNETVKQAVARVQSITDQAERRLIMSKLPRLEIDLAIAATTVCIGTLCYAITDRILEKIRKDK